MNFIRARPNISSASIAVVGASSIYLFWKWYTSRQECIPSEWREVGILTDLMCFPIKSCGIVRKRSMECTQFGLRVDWLRDRDFIVTDCDGRMITARVQPKLMLIKPVIIGDELTLTAPKMEPVTIKISILPKIKTHVTMWHIKNNGVDCGDDVAKWISKFILDTDTGMRLLHCPVNFVAKRRSKLRAVVTDDDSGIYPDLTSYNLINESSIDDLNTRMDDHTIEPQSFRPNFVVKGPNPLEEDEWKWVRIGEVVFKVVKHCTRCVMTTVDWKNGEKNKNGEPLATLRKYRMIGTDKYDKNSPVMGIHLVLRKPGNVHLADTVYVS